ncbi:hypothetical protein NYA8BAC_02779 [Psychrobacter okhotskensis]|uniref:penicillin acylase family protein n=2 Tax=Moraxellaceae TaxID=468 RepID=UPI00223478B9
MNILIRNQRAPTLTLLTMAVSLALFGCSDNDNSFNDDDIDTPAATYEADIQRTQFGIPHITAKDYKGLGYGVGYAFAEDNICSLAHEIVVVRACCIWAMKAIWPAMYFIPGITLQRGAAVF